ncbi:chromosomal replication initiator protein DnaA [Neoactinobaculum massilliense]|uniref:chromosomal replication initiator protein DnaA n=1 Tax=Neoactinobaculum massilliense TaxID=2364794 RepID=UPI000F520087
MGAMNPARDAWNAALELLRMDHALSDSQTAFARMVYPIATVDGTFLVAVGSDFVKTWVETHLTQQMTDMLSAILGRQVTISISVDPSVNDQPSEDHDDPAPARGTSSFDDRYSELHRQEQTPHPQQSYVDYPSDSAAADISSSATDLSSDKSSYAEPSDAEYSVSDGSGSTDAPRPGSYRAAAAAHFAHRKAPDGSQRSTQPQDVAFTAADNHYRRSREQRGEAASYENGDTPQRIQTAKPASRDYQSDQSAPQTEQPVAQRVAEQIDQRMREQRAPQQPPAQQPQQGLVAVAQPAGYTEMKDSSFGNQNDAEFLERSKAAGLNAKYTFDNFVVGESNRFASATALAVAESPGTTYNPLFLYSDSGMGKTHLMHAIGNYTLSLYPNRKVRYISADEFTTLFINSLRDDTRLEFKKTFRNVDVLLIDDIQFIGSRESTVQEFFHTFNTLTMANKQIVITSDVAPNLLNGFEERMLSRFSSGVVAAIDRPNLETRIAILGKKAAADRITVPRDVMEFIASNMTTNVREMEGALRRVTAFADLTKEPVSLTLAKMVLKDLIANPDSVEITPSVIMTQTATYFQVSLDEITGPDRSRSIVTARQIAMYLCREMTSLSLPKIGEIFGGRDHTTVMHAYRKIDKQMAEKQTTYNQVSELSVRIKQAATQQTA